MHLFLGARRISKANLRLLHISFSHSLVSISDLSNIVSITKDRIEEVLVSKAAENDFNFRLETLAIRQEVLRELHRKGGSTPTQFSNALDKELLQWCTKQFKSRLTKEHVEGLSELLFESFTGLMHRNVNILPNTTCDVIVISMCNAAMNGSEIITMDRVIVCFNQMKINGYSPGIEIYHQLMLSLLAPEVKLSSRRSDVLDSLLSSASRSGVQITSKTFCIIYSALGPLNLNDNMGGDVFMFERQMLENFAIPHDEHTLFSIISVLMAGRNYNQALDRFEDMRQAGFPRSRELYNMLFFQCSKRFWMAQYALQDLQYVMLRDCKEFGWLPDEETYRHLFYCCARTHDLTTAVTLLTTMERNDLEPDSISRTIIKFLHEHS
ncbi:hypothetical protein HK096_007591 [Nowakowskiella sp. JEL0078]|nr:hypothetical protein HK096_007591 [Nowakowskiella sp. JEL0078]